MKKGKFIVIDGPDGSGKATQAELLVKRLQKRGLKAKKIDFPRYYNNFFGKLIGDALAGDFGDFIGVNPHIASVLYAADRWETAPMIRKWLDQGITIVADRYVSANQIHQGGKISDPTVRKEFLKWLDTMEHKVFKIPRPDLVLYLHVPYEVGQQWLKDKLMSQKKKYLSGKKDQAEGNTDHLKNSQESALMLAKEHKNWHKIECCEGMVCMLPEGVHEHIFDKVKKLLKVK